MRTSAPTFPKSLPQSWHPTSLVEIAYMVDCRSMTPGLCIRLLHVFPGSSEAPIRCKLTRITLNTMTPYEALSYTWGYPTKTTEIMVNHTTVQVTLNLEAALRYLRRRDITRTRSVDAICINQSDIDERGSQFREMAHIYRSATPVVVCLGPGTLWSDIAMEHIQHIKYAKDHTAEHPSKRMSHFAIASQKDLQDLLISAFNDLLRRAWQVSPALLSRITMRQHIILMYVDQTVDSTRGVNGDM
jgi:hypothetical protein